MRTLSLLSLACVLGLAGCGGNCCPKDGQKDACCGKKEACCGKEAAKCPAGCTKPCCAKK